jgi:hypothetical protein
VEREVSGPAAQLQHRPPAHLSGGLYQGGSPDVQLTRRQGARIGLAGPAVMMVGLAPPDLGEVRV